MYEFKKLRDMRDAAAGFTFGGLAVMLLGAIVVHVFVGHMDFVIGLILIGSGVAMVIRAGVLADRMKKASRDFHGS